MVILRIHPINNHIITQNTIRFYVFWGVKSGSAHIHRAGTYDVGKGVIENGTRGEGRGRRDAGEGIFFFNHSRGNFCHPFFSLRTLILRGCLDHSAAHYCAEEGNLHAVIQKRCIYLCWGIELFPVDFMSKRNRNFDLKYKVGA